MTNWKDFKKKVIKGAYYKVLRDGSGGKTKTKVQDVIFTLDTETTSLFHHATGWGSFDYSKPATYYRDIDKCGLLYIWQLGVEDDVYYGRTIDELKEFMKLLDSAYPGLKIIYVHNLGFDLEFLLGDFVVEDMFARTPHKPIKCKFKDFNFEFRCSLMLTNSSLEKLPSNYGFEGVCEKKTGDLDYSLVRTPLTPLTEKEQGYCEYDIKVLYTMLSIMRKRFRHVYDIPLTSTGIIRQEVKYHLHKDKEAMEMIRGCAPTLEIYRLLQLAFAGGYTHANAHWVDKILRNLNSFDFSSSYPAQMMLQKYPCTTFTKCDLQRVGDMEQDKAYIVRIRLDSFSSKLHWNYLSKSKELTNGDFVVDNGRIVEGLGAEFVLTEQDINTVFESYTVDDYTIIEAYQAKKDYLPKTFTDIIVEKYINKTKLKGVEGAEDTYRISKAFINGLYGMCVTQSVRPDVAYLNGEWVQGAFTPEIEQQKLDDVNKRSFLVFAWGVWITAYARRALWRAIIDLDDDVVYCDTDSIKVIGNHTDYIENYNKNVITALKSVAAERGYTYEQLAPKSPDGQEHPFGIFDFDGHYDEFKTLGAKKYCYQTNGEYHITVSGLAKKKAAKIIHSMNDFSQNKLFGYNDSGRTISYYMNKRVFDVTDYNGISYHAVSNKSVCIQPTTYKLGIGDEFEEYLILIASRPHNFSGL